jgi:hypothetical protein
MLHIFYFYFTYSSSICALLFLKVDQLWYPLIKTDVSSFNISLASVFLENVKVFMFHFIKHEGDIRIQLHTRPQERMHAGPLFVCVGE